MGLRLVDDDIDVSIELKLDPSIREALMIQMQRSSFSGALVPFESRFIRQLTEVIDADLRPPTWKQVHYALAIARALNVQLPGEALRFMGSMFEFLARYEPLFKQREQRTQAAAPE